MKKLRTLSFYALEIGLKIKTLELKGDSFSIDVLNDYNRALIKFKFDKSLADIKIEKETNHI